MSDERTSGLDVGRGHFDEDGALHLSGFDALASRTRGDWEGASFRGAALESDVCRAHTTCPHCASQNNADAEFCWNCGSAM